MVELVVRLVFSLGIVLGLLWVVTRIGAKKFRGHTSAPIRVLHRQALSRGSAVSVVSVGNRLLVLGTTEHKISLLTELEPHEYPAALTSAVAAEDLVTEADIIGETEPHLVPVPAPVATAPVAAPAPAARPAVVAAYGPAPAPYFNAAAMAQPAPALEQAAVVQAEVEQASFEPSTNESAEKVASAQKAARAAEGALAGSLLSAQTWKQAFAAATGKGQVAS